MTDPIEAARNAYRAELSKPPSQGAGDRAWPAAIAAYHAAQPSDMADRLRAEAAELLHPEEMAGRKIYYKECPVGHGVLVGENWLDKPCQTCRAEAAEALHPEEMAGRKIYYKKCSVGHGVLVGENWVDNPCQCCRAEAAEAELKIQKDLQDNINETATTAFKATFAETFKQWKAAEARAVELEKARTEIADRNKPAPRGEPIPSV